MDDDPTNDHGRCGRCQKPLRRHCHIYSCLRLICTGCGREYKR